MKPVLKQNSWLSSWDRFESLFNDDFFTSFLGLTNKSSYPYDLYEKDKEVVLEVPLAGYSKNDIKVEVTPENVLTVSVEKEEKNDNAKYHHKNIKRSHLHLQFPLGKAVKIDGINSSFKDGMLVVNMPKNEVEKEEKSNKEIVIN